MSNTILIRRYKVYMHQNKINGKVYIGITCQNIKRRWRKGSSYSYNQYFDADIKKYGWDNFSHIVLLEELTKEEAQNKEAELIKFHKSNRRKHGYNIENGGHVNCVSAATKKKLRLAQLGRKMPPWFSQFASELHKGNKNMLGKKATEKAKRKMSESHKGSKNGNAKPVCQLDSGLNLIKEWGCITDACKEHGFSNSAISMNLKGKSTTAYNFVWRYADGQK